MTLNDQPLTPQMRFAIAYGLGFISGLLVCLVK